MVGGSFGAELHAQYTLKISTAENVVDINFELGPNREHGTWAPPAEVPKLKARLTDIARVIAASVGGQI